MKLQFAFGNPSRKKKSKRTKKIAKARKKKKTSLKVGTMAKKKRKKVVRKKHKALKRKVHSKRRKHGKRKRNPEYFKVFKGGREIYQTPQILDAAEEKDARSKIASALAKYKGLPLGAAKRAAYEELKATGSLRKALERKVAEKRTLDRFRGEGATVRQFAVGHIHTKPKGSKMTNDEKKLAGLKEKYKRVSGAEKTALLQQMLKLSAKIKKEGYQMLKPKKGRGSSSLKKSLGAWAAAASGKKPRKPRKSGKKGEEVATKKRGPKKSTKKRGPKKSTVKKAVTKKSTKKKSTAKKAAARKAAAKRAAAKKHSGKKHTKKASSKRRGRKKKYVKMIKHRHSIQTRHIRKGGTTHFKAKKHKRHYSIKSYFGKGKKRVKMTGRISVNKKGLNGIFKINPFRKVRNMADKASTGLKKITGHSGAELVGLAIGGVAVPFANKIAVKIAPGPVSMLSQYVGEQNAGSILPIFVGVALKAIAEHKMVKQYIPASFLDAAGVIGEGMAAAGVVSLSMGISNNNIVPVLGPKMGLAGIPYGMNGIPYGMGGIPSGMGIYPQLNGVQYTPDMSGVQYTPMSGINYTPDMHGVDFGAANYGGGGGTVVQKPGDFGADWSQDSIADHWGTEDDELSSAMN